MFKRCLTTSAVFAMLALAGIALISGCGNLQAPAAPGQTPTVQKTNGSAYSSDGPFTLVFSPKALDPSRARAAKPTASNKISGPFSPKKGGKLEVKLDDRGDDHSVSVQKATLEVQKGSIDHEVEISMTVLSGSALDDIAVLFTPSGLRFTPPAKLTLVLNGNLDEQDVKALKAYHIEGQTSQEISVLVYPSGKNEWTVILKVPGFSIYSLGNDLIPETVESLGL